MVQWYLINKQMNYYVKIYHLLIQLKIWTKRVIIEFMKMKTISHGKISYRYKTQTTVYSSQDPTIINKVVASDFHKYSHLMFEIIEIINRSSYWSCQRDRKSYYRKFNISGSFDTGQFFVTGLDSRWKVFLLTGPAVRSDVDDIFGQIKMSFIYRLTTFSVYQYKLSQYLKLVSEYLRVWVHRISRMRWL
jgi:hypothetical protein